MACLYCSQGAKFASIRNTFMLKDKKFLYAIATLVGTIVGVGMFGIS
ncbi:unnamed protein product, partial [marine sediment metagenome]